MKYDQYAIKDNKGDYIKHGTAYSKKTLFTNSLYDPHLFKTKEEAQKIANYLINIEKMEGLTIILI